MKHLKSITLVRADALSNFTNGLWRLWNEFTRDKKNDFGL